VKQADTLNLLAMMADSEARSTATLIELVAAAALAKLNPPTGDEATVLTISQEDFSSIAGEFTVETHYDENGTMTLRLSR
jgi:hypothetical protein